MEVSVSTLTSVVDRPAAEQTLHWLALGLTPGLGPSRARRLVEHFGSIAAVFRASLTELEATGLLAVSAQSLGTGKSLELAQEELAKAVSAGVAILAFVDPAYPARLKEIYDPPLVLYVRGNVNVLALPCIAVVGTRHPTPYGSGMAERLGIDLTARGLIILSGMARGRGYGCAPRNDRGQRKDRGRIRDGSRCLYPKENTRLAEQILAFGGALISKFPLGTFAAPQNFPIRNRIISGMSIGVLVVEAAEYSGTRITARCALEQNREVFAVPGNVHEQEFLGPQYADQARREAGGHLG